MQYNTAQLGNEPNARNKNRHRGQDPRHPRVDRQPCAPRKAAQASQGEGPPKETPPSHSEVPDRPALPAPVGRAAIYRDISYGWDGGFTAQAAFVAGGFPPVKEEEYPPCGVLGLRPEPCARKC